MSWYGKRTRRTIELAIDRSYRISVIDIPVRNKMSIQHQINIAMRVRNGIEIDINFHLCFLSLISIFY